MTLERLGNALVRPIRAPWPGREEALAGLGLTGLVLFLCRDAVFRGRVFYERDILLVWYPQVESFVRAIAAGSWPTWDLSISFGQPLLADPSAQILYPWTWLNLVLRPWTYYTVLVVSHLVLSSVGFFLLGRRLGLAHSSAFVAAAVWVTSGPLLSLVNLWHHFTGACWMPWVVLAGDLTVSSRRWSWALLWGAASALQILAGSADMCVLTAVVLAARTVPEVRWRRPFDPGNRRLVVILVAGFAFALALSAALWMPALDVVRRSARWGLPADMRTYWSVHPARLLQVLWPVSLNDLPLRPEYRALWFEGREPFLFSLYLGLPAVALVGAAFLNRGTESRRLLVLMAGAVLFALGRYGIVYDVATRLAPPLTILRYPEKAMVLAGFCWALLVGTGLAAWRDSDSPLRRGWGPLVATPLVFLLVLGGGGALLARHQPAVWAGFLLAAPEGILAGQVANLVPCLAVSLVVLCLAVLRCRATRRASWISAAAALLVVVDLLVACRNLNPTGLREVFTDPPPALAVLKRNDHSRTYTHEYFHAAGKSRQYLKRDVPYQLARFLKDWPIRLTGALAMRMYLATGPWGVEGSYEADMRGLYSSPLAMLTRAARVTEGTLAHLRLLQVGAVGHVVALHEAGLELLEPVAAFPGLLVDPIRVFRVPNPLPRAYAVGSARVADGLAALQILTDPGFDPSREVVLAAAPPGDRTSAPEAGFSGSTRILELHPDRVRLEALLAEAGYVVLVDSYDPGWRATIDGRPAAVLRANLGFRAVRVPRGRHVVEYAYRPRAMIAGVIVSAAALLVGLGAVPWLLRPASAPRASRATAGDAP